MRLYDQVRELMVKHRLKRAERSGETVTLVLDDGEKVTGRIIKVDRHVKVRTPSRAAWLPRRDIQEVRRDG